MNGVSSCPPLAGISMLGHALRRRDRHHRRYLCRLLGSGGAAAPERESLALLPSGPDAVRTLPVRGTRSSTPRAQTLSRRTVPRTAFGPAWSGFRVQGTADSPPSAAEHDPGYQRSDGRTATSPNAAHGEALATHGAKAPGLVGRVARRHGESECRPRCDGRHQVVALAEAPQRQGHG